MPMSRIRRYADWIDVSTLGSPWEVHYQSSTGRHRHRKLAGRDPDTLDPLPNPAAEWHEGPPPEGPKR
jgi:hypothetical protein